MKMDEHARAWAHEVVAQVLETTSLPPEQRSSLHWEILSHLHEAADRRAEARGGAAVTLADLQIVVAEMGGREGLAAAFLRPRVASTPRAGWAKRAGALLVDATIVLTGLAVVGIVLEPFLSLVLEWGPLSAYTGDLLVVAWAALAFAYLTVTEFRYGATVGKMAFKLQVVRVDGSRLTPEAAMIRNVAKVVPPLLLVDLVLYFLAFQRDDQRASDRIADTIAIDTTRTSWAVPPPPPVTVESVRRPSSAAAGRSERVSEEPR